LVLVVVTLALGRPMAVRALNAPPPTSTPQALLQFLTTVVDDLVAAGELPSGRAQALSARLDAAITKLARGDTPAAIDKVGAFIDKVEAFITKGILSQVDGDILLNAADTLLVLLSS